ncbi:MAG: hypothetical protein A2341_23110 [Deltaproteobacteria bacterium RIFOXYB12_FULL_58_9]|nr:MAG: hypothetical protein A2341_23110 [Deltaproteobacteria bacterium RIFOXYB12_FULL_58_9]
MKILLLTTLSALVACGDVGLVSVVTLVPTDGSLIMSADAEGTANFLITDEVDTVENICIDEDYKCFQEPYGNHFALVTVANDNPADPRNPLFGKVELRGFSLSLEGISDGAPELEGASGGVRQTIRADSQESFLVVLADPATKKRFRNQAGLTYHKYTASYVFSGPNGIEVRGATTVVFGNYNYCEPGHRLADECRY